MGHITGCNADGVRKNNPLNNPLITLLIAL